MSLEINLIPAALSEAQTRRRHLRAWAGSLVPALLLLFAAAGFNWLRQARADETAAAAEQLAVQLDAVRAEVRHLTAAVNEKSLQLKRAEALRSKRSWSGLMGLLAQARPEDVWFSTIATDPASPSGARSVPIRTGTGPGKQPEAGPVMIDAPRKLLITGYSISPTGPLTLVTNMKKENLFSRVSLENSMRSADEKQARFEFDVIVEW